jgi:hypothetical protein
MNMIPDHLCCVDLMDDNLRSRLHQVPVSIERVQAMARWFTHTVFCGIARTTAAKNLVRIQERDNRWIALASDAFGLSEGDLQDNVALGGDNVFLAILIDISRRALPYDSGLVETLTRFNIHHTLPRLQHDFCTLWNELVQADRNRRHAAATLRLIRHHYIALHQDTDDSINGFDSSLFPPSSYPLCNPLSHRVDSVAHIPVPTSRAVPFPAQSDDSATAIIGPPSPSDPTQRQLPKSEIPLRHLQPLQSPLKLIPAALAQHLHPHRVLVHITTAMTKARPFRWNYSVTKPSHRCRSHRLLTLPSTPWNVKVASTA